MPRKKAPFSSCTKAALIYSYLASMPYFFFFFLMNNNQKAPVVEAEQCWEMRLNVQTIRPSILQCPPHQKLTACERMGKSELGGMSCNWFGIRESRWRIESSNLSAFSAWRRRHGRFFSIFSYKSFFSLHAYYDPTVNTFDSCIVQWKKKIHQTIYYNSRCVGRNENNAGVMILIDDVLKVQGHGHSAKALCTSKFAFAILNNAVCENNFGLKAFFCRVINMGWK